MDSFNAIYEDLYSAERWLFGISINVTENEPVFSAHDQGPLCTKQPNNKDSTYEPGFGRSPRETDIINNILKNSPTGHFI
jgi:hypothetical protein